MNFNEFNLLFEVSKNKEFFGPQILTTLNAKLNLPKEIMVEEINKWLLDPAKEEGIELTEDQLDAVSGGACLPIVHEDRYVACPNCGFVTRGQYVNSSAKGRMYEF